jgi:uncharacterized protein YfiM (DUF2279 family)
MDTVGHHDDPLGSPEGSRPRWDEFGTALLAYGFFSLLASFADPLIPRAGEQTAQLLFTVMAGVVNAGLAVTVIRLYHRYTGRQGAVFGLRLGVTWAATALLLNAAIQAASGFQWPGLADDHTGSLVLAQLAGWGSFMIASWVASDRLGTTSARPLQAARGTGPEPSSAQR